MLFVTHARAEAGPERVLRRGKRRGGSIRPFTARAGSPLRSGLGRTRRARAFTLVEIMVVVIIIGVLATLIVPTLFSKIGKAKTSVAKQKLSSLEQAVQLFDVDYGRFPQNLGELTTRPADIDPGKWDTPTIKDKDLTDPWGNQWQYQYPGDHGVFDLYSYGADGQQGGDGANADITNW